MLKATTLHLLGMTLITSSLLNGCSKEDHQKSASTPNVPAEISKSEALVVPVSETLPHYLARDIQDDIFYFVMPDRFHNANPANDMGDPNRPISYGGLDKTSKWAFHGGDIPGVTAKLDYIQNLGISAIWMTPILRNKAVQKDGFGHHGYWVVDFTEIDPHFGSNDDLKILIDEAHARNIKVFFDIITNHTADVIKFKECHDTAGKFLAAEQKGCPFKTEEQLANGDTYTPFVPEKEVNVKVPAWLNDPAIYNNQGDSIWQGESVITGDFAGLDDINTSLPTVQENMINVFNDLITEFKPDGFRIDTVKHVDIEFWQAFAPAIVKHAQSIGIPKFHIFGEVYDGNPAVLSDFTTTGKLPSVLDFGFHFNVKDVLYSGMDVNRLSTLFSNDDFYRDHDSTPLDLMNFLGNHDAGRVGYFIEQGFPNITDAEKLQRSKLSHTFMYLSRGVPVVYYGDEQGFTGDGGDVDARENMDPSQVNVYNDNTLIGTSATTADSNFDPNHPIYKTLVNLAKLRSAHPALSRGEHHNRHVDADKHLYAFSRIAADEQKEYIAVFNMSNTRQSLTLDVDSSNYEQLSGEIATVSNNKAMFDLPPLSYSLVRATEKAPLSIAKRIEISNSYIDNGKLVIPFEIEFENTLALHNINLSIFSIDETGSRTFLAKDTTYPYRLILPTEHGSKLNKIEVVASNFDDIKIQKKISLTP